MEDTHTPISMVMVGNNYDKNKYVTIAEWKSGFFLLPER